MKPGLEPRKAVSVQFGVTTEMCPHFDGALIHPVCATWTLVSYMEYAGRKLLAPHLEDDEEAVGAHISVDHRGPAPIGSQVNVTAQVESCTRRRLTCTVAAHLNQQLIANGRFVQVIMKKARLRSLFDQQRP